MYRQAFCVLTWRMIDTVSRSVTKVRTRRPFRVDLCSYSLFSPLWLGSFHLGLLYIPWLCHTLPHLQSISLVGPYLSICLSHPCWVKSYLFFLAKIHSHVWCLPGLGSDRINCSTLYSCVICIEVYYVNPYWGTILWWVIRQILRPDCLGLLLTGHVGCWALVFSSVNEDIISIFENTVHLTGGWKDVMSWCMWSERTMPGTQ